MGAKRILVVTEAEDAWPSAYIRALIYKDLFASQGFEVDYCSRLVPAITKLIIHPDRLISRIMGLGVGRGLGNLNSLLAAGKQGRIVKQAREYDVIYLQKVLSVPFVAALRRSSSARIVYDLNDGIWLPWMARFLDGRVEDILQLVDAVTCDNSYGTEFARRYNQNAFVVPDPPQIEVFDRHRRQWTREGSSVVLGWIGSATTAFNLYSVWEPLEMLFDRFDNIDLRLVGVGHDWRLLPRFEKVRYTTVPFYSQVEMVREVLQMDIGLFPLFDIEDSRARGILKASVYMSGEACVIASPIGDSRDLITDGVTGVFAQTARDWITKMTSLVEDTQLRQRIARAGRSVVRERFTLDHCYNHLKRVLVPDRD